MNEPSRSFRTSVLSILALAGAVACSSSSNPQQQGDAGSSTDSGGIKPKTDGGMTSKGDAGGDATSGSDGGGHEGGGGGDTGSHQDASRSDGASSHDSGGGSDAHPSDDGGGGSDAHHSDSGGGAGTCSTGTLFAGDPTYGGDPSNPAPSGTGIHADPPLQWQNLVFAGNLLYTHVVGELWYTDLSATSPVETRVAGMNDPSAYAYQAGACSTALFADIRDIGVLADGSVVIADVLGNGILHVISPTTPASCTVEYWAGNHTTNSDIDPSDDAPDLGDMNGPGASAQFNGPESLVVDGSNNVFFYDSGNNKIRQVGTTSPYTVKTLATIPSTSNGTQQIFNMTVLGTAIYAIATDQVESIVLRIDIATGAVTTVLHGGGDAFPPLDSSTFPQADGIANDGTGLYVAGSGYVWYLTTAGVIHVVAGSGLPVDFPPSGYNPAVSHPALDLALPTDSSGASVDVGSSDFITYSGGAVYFRGAADGAENFIERISCP